MRCKARSARTGKQCRAYAIRGGTVCRTHGGAAPQVKAAAARNLARERGRTRAMWELKHLGIPADVEPLDALLHQVRVAHTNAEFWRDLIVKLSEPFDNGKPHPAFEEYGSWSERAARYAKLALDAGVEERTVRLQELEGRMFAGIILRALDDPALQLTPAQRQTILGGVAREMKALAKETT